MTERTQASRRTDGEAAEIIAFLRDPSAYDPPVSNVKQIDTHGAIVFLAGNRAYKVKRPVRLPYLDYSTLERRRRFCLREVERNKEAAPDIYIGVVAITRETNGRLAIDGHGVVVEWAVVMRRFDDTAVLDEMADRGELPIELMVRLADRIAAYHAAAQRSQSSRVATRLSTVINTVVASAFVHSDLLGRARVEDNASALHDLLEANADLIEERTRRGFVRLCHGDLHLQNIVIENDEPILVDAIEFDDAIATIDVLYDLAFVLMDLWRRGSKRHANVVLNRYLETTAAPENLVALKLLPLFLAMRAGVRMMVAFDRSAQTTGAEQDRARSEGQRYFALMQEFLAPQEARLVAIGGLSGTGKSTVAAGLAPCLGAPPGAVHLRSDIERKQIFAVSPTTRLGPEAYTPSVSVAVYRRLFEKAEATLSAGHAVILDAAFLLSSERERAAQTGQQAHARFDGLWLEASRDALIARVTARHGDASDADADVVRRQFDMVRGDVDWNVIDANTDKAGSIQAAAACLGIDQPGGAGAS